MNTKTHKTFFLLALLLAASLVAGKILVSKYAEDSRQSLPKQAETAQIESQVDQTQPTPASTPTPQPTPEPQAGTYINTKHGFKFDYPKELAELRSRSGETDYISFQFGNDWLWFSFAEYGENSERVQSNISDLEWIKKMLMNQPGSINKRGDYTYYEKHENIVGEYPMATYYSHGEIPGSEPHYGYNLVWERNGIHYEFSIASGLGEPENLQRMKIIFDDIVKNFKFIEVSSDKTLN